MNYLNYIILMLLPGVLIVVAILAIIYIYNLIQYNKSTYKNITKTNFNKVFFNKGSFGEYKTSINLSKLKQNKKMLFNVYLFKADDSSKTTEIDIIMITNKAVYVIENKNYSGKIYGNENQNYWYYYLGGNKYKIYSPIKQNITHVSALHNLIPNIPIFSVICFNNNTNIDKVSSKNYLVCKSSEIDYKINTLENILPVRINNENMQLIFNMLLPYTQVSEQTKLEHIEIIEKMKA